MSSANRTGICLTSWTFSQTASFATGIWLRPEITPCVNIVPLRNDIDITILRLNPLFMPRTRMDELYALAEEHDGLLASKDARAQGIQDSVLVRLAQRGRLERMSRGVYRIAHFPADRLAQYREAVLWAQASQGPERVALSHETA